jgi:TrmH family RNA methyltransferase
MRILTSRTHPEIKRVVSLHTVPGRSEYGLFIAEGFRTCSTLVDGGMKPIACYITPNIIIENFSFIKQTPVTQVPPGLMEKMSTATTPSGFLCLFKIPYNPDPSDLRPGLLIINLSDPGNMGTLIRSAAAFGIKRITHINTVDIWNPKVVQASVGTSAYVSFHKVGISDIRTYKGDRKFYALVAQDGEDPCKVNTHKDFLVVGGEAYGIPDDFLEICDERITLPMTPMVESLNAAVAGSIALYISFTL